MTLGFRVETSNEVGGIIFSIARASDGVFVIVLVDASRSKDSTMDASEIAAVCQVDGSNNVGANCRFFIVLAPVNIWPSSTASSVEDMSWVDLHQLLYDGCSVLHTSGGCMNVSTFLLQESFEVAGNPAMASPDQETRWHRLSISIFLEEHIRVPILGSVKIGHLEKGVFCY